jgi:quercetin dioxygenase-like cupin family protein
VATVNTDRILLDAGPLGDALGSCRTSVLRQYGNLRIVRLVLVKGRAIADHFAAGDASLICLEGKLAVTLKGLTHELRPGLLICFAAGESHAIKALEDSSALLTIATQEKSGYEIDIVQEASEESFPASDPPARSPIIGS